MQEELIDPNKKYINVEFNGTLYAMEVSSFRKSLYSVMADFKKQVEKVAKMSSFVVEQSDMRGTAEAGDPIDFYFAKHNEFGDDETLYPEKGGNEMSLNDYGIKPNDELYILTEAIPG